MAGSRERGFDTAGLGAHPVPRPAPSVGSRPVARTMRTSMQRILRPWLRQGPHPCPHRRRSPALRPGTGRAPPNTGQEQVCPVRRLRRLQPHRTGRGCRPPRVRLARRLSVPRRRRPSGPIHGCVGDGRDPLVGYHQLDQFHEMAGRLGLHGLFVQRRGVMECRGVGERGGLRPVRARYHPGGMVRPWAAKARSHARS